MQKRWAFTTLSTAAAALLLAACNTLPDNVAPPAAAVANLRFVNITPFETNAVVTIRLDNENPFPLAVSGGVFRVGLGGRDVGKAMTGDDIRLPRFSSVTREVPLRISNLAMTLQAIDVMHTNEVRYTLDSTLYVQYGGRTRKSTAVSEGTIQLKGRELQQLRGFMSNRTMYGTE